MRIIISSYLSCRMFGAPKLPVQKIQGCLSSVKKCSHKCIRCLRMSKHYNGEKSKFIHMQLQNEENLTVLSSMMASYF